MAKENTLKIWMAQVRANFLILAVFLVIIGIAFSLKYPTENNSSFNVIHAILIVIGVVLSHISVNLFNEYSDFKTRIDYYTSRTPFSGGSGMMTSGKTRPEHVRLVGITTITIAALIGIYFSFVSHWIIFIISLIGGFSVIFYTNFLAKNVLGELFAGLSLGTLVVLGTYISMTAAPGTPLKQLLPTEVIWISIPPGILTSLLLFINQFPDIEADKQGGRKHMVIRFGIKRSSYIYAFGMFITFAIIVLMPIVGISSPWIYISLLPLPLAIKASLTAIRHGNDFTKMVSALANNVMTVLGTDLLLAIAVFIDVIK
jgi:1,4-dihydroxy-2-naphthoate octaprenyltransferase